MLFQKDACDGHQNDVEGGNEAGFAGGGGLQALLLEVGGYRQRCAAAKTAQDQIPAGMGPGLGLPRKIPAAAQAQHHAQAKKENKGDGCTGGVEGKGLHVICAHALGHERRAPDQRGQNRKYILTNPVDFHMACSAPGSMVYFFAQHFGIVTPG